MQLRHMARRGSASAIGGLWVLVATAAVGLAQPLDPALPEMPPVEPPLTTLPETEVFGDPLRQPDFTVPPDFGIYDSPLAGSIFDSPPPAGYRADSATSGSRIDLPLLDLPATVDVVPRVLLEEQAALRLEDALRNVPAAIKTGDTLRPDALLLRGFEVRPRDMRKNGFLDPTFAPRDLANVERIEVLKGPASLLYGNGQPSGIVNFITEKPLAEPRHVFDYQFGRHNLHRTTVDSTGPVDECGTLLYRINFAYEDTESFRDYGFNDRVFVSPAVTWNVSDVTRVTWEFEYLKDRRRFDSGVAVFGGQYLLPVERFLNEPQDFQHFTDYRSTFFITHELNDIWTLRFGGYSTWGESPASATVPVANPFATFLVRQRRDIDPFAESYHSLIADLAGDFCLFGMRHRVLVGTEQGWQISNDFTARQSDPNVDPLLIDAANPVYGQDPLATPWVYRADYTQNRHGVYVQDLVDVTPHWSVLAGVRYDAVHLKFAREFFPFFPEVRNDQNFYRFSPKVGVIYQPLPELLSLYGSYSESFDVPGGGPRVLPDPLDPELGRSWEGGIKAQLLDDLAFTVSGFYTNKDNVIVDDLTTFTTTQVGRVRSQGVEMALIGRLTDRWQMLANYAYVDARIREDADPARVGNRFRGAPYHSGALWTRYDLVQTDCQTLGVGLGLVGVGNRPGDLDASFRLPAYARWDAGVFYRVGAITANVYFENLGDIDYYHSAESDLAVFPGSPFSVRATVGITW